MNLAFFIGYLCGAAVVYAGCWWHWHRPLLRDLKIAEEDAYFWKDTARLYGIDTKRIEERRVRD